MAKKLDRAETERKHGAKAALRAAQIDLVKLQRHVIEAGLKVAIIFEGRDAAGKDGTIKKIVQHLSPREDRVVALGPPSDRDRKAWYFQRYVAQLPVEGEIVLFNRSWYNRAGVEHVMKFCTDTEYRTFLTTAPLFEELLVHCGITLIKYYLDISKDEQSKRLRERRDDPLSQWKLSPIDAKATKLWDHYSDARNEMLMRTHTVAAPWTIIKADNKPAARIGVIRDILTRLEFDGGGKKTSSPDPDIVFRFNEAAIQNGSLAK
ncbi:MAG: polyphosphate kinase 2 [Candidatus Saccharibacteria bacterium]|nr:polyphosphate kinase 2 [Pseudorhodobacter sp.]